MRLPRDDRTFERRVTGVVVALLALLLSAASCGDPPIPAVQVTFDLSVTPGEVELERGGEAAVVVASISRSGATGTVAIGVRALPSGVSVDVGGAATAAREPSTTTVRELAFSASSAASVGRYEVVVRATDVGNDFVAEETITVVVTDPEASEPTFAITADAVHVSPFETVGLGIAGAGADVTFMGELDLSGTARFADGDVIEMPLFLRGGMLMLGAPDVDVVDRAYATNRYDVRIRRSSDGAVSNSVGFEQREPPGPAAAAGVPTGTLDLVLNGLFATSDTRMARLGTRLGLSTVFDAATSLGHDTAALDRMATSILSELFDADGAAASASVDRALLGPIRDGMARIGSCLEDLMGEAGGFLAGAATLCSTDDLDAALRVVWEGSAGSITDVFDRLARVANTGASMLTRPFSHVTNVTDGLVHRAYLSNVVQRSGTLALYSNEYGRTNDLAPFLDYVVREVTRDYLTSHLDDFTHVLYDFIDGDRLLDYVIDLDFGARQHIVTLEGELTTSIEDFLLDQIVNPGVYGGDPDDVSGIDEVTEWIPGTCPMPDEEFLAGVGVTCAQIEKGLEDPVKVERYLLLLFELLDVLEFLSGPLCELDPHSLMCEIARETLIATAEEIIALFADVDVDFACSNRYASFDSSDPRFVTCIHGSLVVEAPSPGVCSPGSYVATSRGLDVGREHVCVLYSRDYFQADGTCREGYRETFFDSVRRCRWSGLADREDAAYAVDTVSGRRATIVR